VEREPWGGGRFGGEGVRHVGCGGLAVGLQRGMDLWDDDAAFCQITLTLFFVVFVPIFRVTTCLEYL